MPLSDPWLEAVLAITGDFETDGDPWTAVSDDFDGMGISCGPLQWNIGQNSLQPVVRRAGRPAVGQAMPMFGAEFWTACTGSIPAGLAIVRGWQASGTFHPIALAELRRFLASPPMHQAMMDAARERGAKAYDLAGAWDGTQEPSGQSVAFFFDVVVQQGSLKGLWREDVEAFITQHGTGKADDLICDWLAARPGAKGHGRDSRRNAELWRDATTPRTLPLLVLGYLRSGLGNPTWRHVTMNRKGTLAMGSGWINSELVDLAGRYPA